MAGPNMTSSDHVSAKLAVSFSHQIVANGATGYTAGALPPGLSINAGSGVISGTPGSVGSYNVPISITSPTGSTDTQIVISVTA